jgi:hypothetical protein
MPWLTKNRTPPLGKNERTMSHPALILAEVADKEPALLVAWGIAAFFSAVCFLLGRWRRWAWVLALPLATGFVCATVSWLRDPNEGPAILDELGRGYVTQAWVAGFVPLLFVAARCFRRSGRHDAT